MDLDPEYPLLNSLDERAFERYFNLEREYMAAEGYANSKEASLRRRAVRVILQYSVTHFFDPFIPYLAMNYFDRFISRHQLPNVLGLVRDDIVLAAIGCLTLAWKMRDSNFEFRGFLKDNKLTEDYKNHILSMELQILSGLRWRMRPINAVCFLSFFVGKIPVGKLIARRSLNEIVIQAQGNIYLTQFKPSVIAASAFLTACKVLFPDEYKRCREDLLARGYVKEEELEPCFQKIYEMCIEAQIDMERSKKVDEGPPLQLEAGESSSSLSLNKDIPTKVTAELEEGAQREPEPSSKPMHDISEIQEEPVSEAGPSTISHRQGKEQMQEEPESKTEPSASTGRPGKEPLVAIPETKELPDETEDDSNWNFELPESMKTILKITGLCSSSSGSEEPKPVKPLFRHPGLDFGLKWELWNSGNSEEFTIDSPLFRSPASVHNRNDGTNRAEARDDSTPFAECTGCILM